MRSVSHCFSIARKSLSQPGRCCFKLFLNFLTERSRAVMPQWNFSASTHSQERPRFASSQARQSSAAASSVCLRTSCRFLRGLFCCSDFRSST